MGWEPAEQPYNLSEGGWMASRCAGKCSRFCNTLLNDVHIAGHGVESDSAAKQLFLWWLIGVPLRS